MPSTPHSPHQLHLLHPSLSLSPSALPFSLLLFPPHLNLSLISQNLFSSLLNPSSLFTPLHLSSSLFTCPLLLFIPPFFTLSFLLLIIPLLLIRLSFLTPPPLFPLPHSFSPLLSLYLLPFLTPPLLTLLSQKRLSPPLLSLPLGCLKIEPGVGGRAVMVESQRDSCDLQNSSRCGAQGGREDGPQGGPTNCVCGGGGGAWMLEVLSSEVENILTSVHLLLASFLVPSHIKHTGSSEKCLPCICCACACACVHV